MPVDERTVEQKQTELYDRQIRLWGVEAQRRLQESKVLVSGIRGLHLEVSKNLVLAGISLVIQDSTVIESVDLSANFFFTLEDIGCNKAKIACERVQDLNQYASVTGEERSLSELDDSFFKSFSVVLLSDCSQSDAIRINNICRANGTGFYWDDSFGLDGCFVTDLGDSFEFKNDPPNNTKLEVLGYPSLLDVIQKPWNLLASKFSPLSITFLKWRVLTQFRDLNAGRSPRSEDFATVMTIAMDLMAHNAVDPTTLTEDTIATLCNCADAGMNMSICAVVGGFLAQEVIKAVSRQGRPMMNVFVFSADDCAGRSFSTA